MRSKTARARMMWTAIACFGLLACAGSSLADEVQDRIDRAILLFEQGQYTAAQELLVKLEPDNLSDDQRAVRDEYVERTRVAITMVEKAELDFERADSALEHEDVAAAKAALKDVLDNEYATAAQRSDARARLNDLDVVAGGAQNNPPSEPAPMAPPPPPATDNGTMAQPAPTAGQEGAKATENGQAAQQNGQATQPNGQAPENGEVSRQQVNNERARSLIQEGYRMLESGRTAEAERLFQSALQAVPGHPEALAGLHEAQRHSDVEVGSQSLIDRMQRRRQIAWERTVFQYRELEKEIKNAVLDKRFDLAKQGLLRARQVLEAGSQFAEPRVRYESLISELNALQQYVEEEQRREEEANVREQREQILRQERERQLQVAETRRRQVNALMDQALQLKKDRDFKGAVAVLNQVLAIDPQNNRAQWMRDDLEDVYELTREYAAVKEKRRQQQAVLVDAEEAKIPWHELLKYPDNWLEIISSPDRVATGRERLSPEDRQLQAKLDKNIPLDIEDVALEEVVDEMARDQGINIT
ncbi:MAG TPA: hypothetical protein P5572_00090, partial [Phycisphaerae bacterium]|nr:hypothetical protein [Phycisphaerae bacterium]